MYRTFQDMIYSYKRNAEKRGIPFELDREEFYKLVHGKCYYCGIEALPRNGVDRVNNLKGYQSDNVVTCCGFCNRLKSDMPYSTFIQQIYKIASYQEKGWVTSDKED